MSLIRKLERRADERRDYGGGVFSNPYGLEPGAIPTNGMLAGDDGSPSSYISIDRALRNWAVFACIRIIADTICALPVDLYKGDEEPIEPVPTKLVHPGAYTTIKQWLWQVMASELTDGNAYGLVSAVDRLEYPSQVDIISPTNASVEKDKDGNKILKVGTKILQPGEFWHMPGPQLPGDLAGLSPIKYAARLINLGLESEKFGSDFFRNGINPTATLETDQQVNSEQAGEIKARVKQSMQNHDLAVLGAGMKLNEWQLNAEDSQFLDTARHNAISIAGIFGVPPEMLGAAQGSGSSITYANREQRAQDFLNNAINPWLARLEESLSAWFPRGTYVKFNTGALLRSDLLTRYQSYALGIRNNFILPSEARALEDLPPAPELDSKPLPSTGSQGSGNDNQQG